MAALADPHVAWPKRRWALLDVREHGAFERGHIPGATALPRRRLEFRLAALVPVRDTPVLLYDDGGGDRRAQRAAQTLRDLGYGRVSILDGGIAAWQALGGVPARGVNVPCKAFGERVLAEDGIPYVDSDGLVARLDAGARIAMCDVRTEEEFADAHLPGAAPTPGFELALRLADLEEAHEAVVVNCAGRTRSIIATATLTRLGAKAVAALENGTMGWRLSGRELEKGPVQGLSSASGRSRAVAAQKALALALDAGVTRLAPDQVAALLTRGAPGAYVLDVRDKAAFTAGHVADAVFAPGGQAVQRADDFIAVPGATIVFVDDGDARALLAAYWYRRMGFEHVHVLEGGMPAWQAAGMPVHRGRGHAEPLGYAQARAGATFVEAAELHERLSERDGAPLVIDVGSSRDLGRGHLPQALGMPRGFLEDHIVGVEDLDRPIVLASREEAQSVFAARTLAQLGFSHVAVLAGGTGAWAAAGFPLATSLADGLQGEDVVEPPYRGGLAAMREYLAWEIALHEPKGSGEPSTPDRSKTQGGA